MELEENTPIENKSVIFKDEDIFIKIWTSPRIVFRFLNDNKYEKYVNILLILAGITKALDRASLKNMGNSMSLTTIIFMSVIFGGLFGWITYYIYAALMSWTGKWIKGEGDTKSLLRMMAHAMIPSILSLFLLIPQIIIFGNEIFQSELNISDYGLMATIIFYLTSLLEFTLGIWSIVLLVIGISEVQKITIGKSILNMFLPGLVILGPIFIIILLIKMIN